ncbi:MAG TPA: pyrimidine dimer DNA glycosylase/endonuclease V [Burkholderiales bacterium]|nr:pyrimidine dimer DNA glycosylase/endonuclease V [Burkholderiales bacterium]
MRIWTLHPKYLDHQGLVALWREVLLARAVLRGQTRGYRHHPQLFRFQSHDAPRSAINAYLTSVLAEAELRGYSFDRRKVGPVRANQPIESTAGQLDYEWQHLMRKLSARSPSLYRRWRSVAAPESHPIFRITRGEVEPWERQLSLAALRKTARRKTSA